MRTIAVALVLWQPFHSQLPAICYVEEACEALLSRAAARIRMFPYHRAEGGDIELFVTLPEAERQRQRTRGLHQTCIGGCL